MENDQQGPQVQTQTGVNSPSSGPSFPDNCFESIDIQPEFRIPSPQPPLWMRCWQPIGTTVMDTRVLKEPRGFIKVLQIVLAIAAFAACANYSSYFEYSVVCNDGKNHTGVSVRHDIVYPFGLDHEVAKNVTCGNHSYMMYPPGDFESDAEFFVFTGCVTMTAAIVCLIVYIFFSSSYLDNEKKTAMIDFVFTLMFAIFWLAASAAWANGVIAMKKICDIGDTSWIYTAKYSVCEKDRGAATCEITFGGRFGGANASILLGFLNFFLWSSNMWFVFKETVWFNPRPRSSHQSQQLP